ncbi:MAG: sigma-54 dependent transcriptional regulator, partial [Nitrospira sp.]|nr:sigma-54 dependent transcriptional regulator [Nitrospira sp.]
LAMRARLEAEVTRLKTAAAGVSLIAESPAMLALLDRLRRAADSDANILLLGETGAGKECLAHFVHTQSNLSGGPFVARNCAAIPEDLFESEMFGHVKGAFTGAAKDRKGAFREAEGGTIFLDEIGDLSYALQTKLLRAIQERTVRPVGADAEIPIRVRIVSATNRELRSAIRNRQFREDLYYRLATVTCVVPPLRERLKDIIPLARHFAKLLSGGTRWLSESAEEALRGQAWPGNVRELRASIEQAAIFASGSEIQPEDLALPTAAERISLAAGNRDGFVGTLADAERAHILRVLEVTGNNKNEAARVLQIARSTLTLKLKLYGL